MKRSFAGSPSGLRRLAADAPAHAAIWIDLLSPTPAEEQELEALGIPIPSLTDMEEIEISNRLYRHGGADYMTVVMPGQLPDQTHGAGPVTFILSSDRLVTVRHHSPRPFDTFPERADRSSAGCGSADRVFLGLADEIVARFADLLEGAGRTLDEAGRNVLTRKNTSRPDFLQAVLEQVARQGELLGRIRLAMLTVERALSFFGQTATARHEADAVQALLKALMHDIQSLGVHAEYLNARLELTVDATLGMINLAQNSTVRIVSIVAALFMPPTLVASIYGMNFRVMPELQAAWGYPAALAMMVASAAATYLFFRWRHWL